MLVFHVVFHVTVRGTVSAVTVHHWWWRYYMCSLVCTGGVCSASVCRSGCGASPCSRGDAGRPSGAHQFVSESVFMRLSYYFVVLFVKRSLVRFHFSPELPVFSGLLARL